MGVSPTRGLEVLKVDNLLGFFSSPSYKGAREECNLDSFSLLSCENISTERQRQLRPRTITTYLVYLLRTCAICPIDARQLSANMSLGTSVNVKPWKCLLRCLLGSRREALTSKQFSSETGIRRKPHITLFCIF